MMMMKKPKNNKKKTNGIEILLISLSFITIFSYFL